MYTVCAFGSCCFGQEITPNRSVQYIYMRKLYDFGVCLQYIASFPLFMATK